MDKWERYAQEDLVVELCCEVETMDEDEWQEKYDSLDPEYQIQVDEAMENFADGAVGCPSWRTGR